MSHRSLTLRSVHLAFNASVFIRPLAELCLFTLFGVEKKNQVIYPRLCRGKQSGVSGMKASHVTSEETHLFLPGYDRLKGVQCSASCGDEGKSIAWIFWRWTNEPGSLMIHQNHSSKTLQKKNKKNPQNKQTWKAAAKWKSRRLMWRQILESSPDGSLFIFTFWDSCWENNITKTECVCVFFPNVKSGLALLEKIKMFWIFDLSSWETEVRW